MKKTIRDSTAPICTQCGVPHDPDKPHAMNSLKHLFFCWPTWADAIAHCSPDVQMRFINVLRGYLVKFNENEDTDAD